MVVIQPPSTLSFIFLDLRWIQSTSPDVFSLGINMYVNIR